MSFQGRKVLRLLLQRGLRVDRETGPHTCLTGDAGRFAVLPHGAQVKRGTARNIARTAKIDWDEFRREVS